LFTDLDLDSIDAVELAIQLQGFTGRRVQAEVFKHVRTVDDVVETVHTMLQSQ
jgi:acyl carrier protein